MGFKLPKIEAAIQMVDNVTAPMRKINQSIDSATRPVNRLKASLRSLGKEARLDQLGAAVKNLGSKLSGVGQGFGKSLARARNLLLGGGGLVGGLALITKQVASFGDNTAKTSRRVGLSVEQLQKLRFAAERSGVDVRTTDMALQRFARRVAEAAAGSGEAKGALEAMGIQLKDNQGRMRKQEDILLDVAGAMEKIPDSQDRLRVAFKLFDSEGAKLVELLGQGKNGVKALTDEFDRLGGGMSESQAKAAEDFQDKMSNLSVTLNAVKIGIGSKLIPVVAQLSEKFREWVQKNSGQIQAFAQQLADKLPSILDSLVQAFRKMIPVIQAVGKILMWIADILGPVNTALVGIGTFVLMPIITALGSMIPALLNFGKAFSRTFRLVLPWIKKLGPLLRIAGKWMVSLALQIGRFLIPVIYNLGAAFMTTPVGWVIAAIAAIALAAWLIYDNWEVIRKFILEMWTHISAFLDTSLGKILALFVFPFIGIPLMIIKHWEPIKDFFLSLWTEISGGFSQFIDKFLGMWNEISVGFTEFMDSFVKAWSDLDKLISESAGKIAKTVEGIPVIGGLLSKGFSFFAGENAPSAPPVAGGVARTVQENNETRTTISRQETRVGVDFRNLPRGARVIEPKGDDVMVTSGYAFSGGF